MKAHSPAATAVAVCLTAALASPAVVAFAAEYPTKPVRIVIGFSAGGGTDIAGRILAQALTDNLKQQFIVENRTGASGTIGADFVARSAPDGYTIFMGSQTTHAVAPQLLPKPPYHPVRDFVAVSELVFSPMLVVVHPSLPVKNIKELVQLAKARPGEIIYGSGGIGTTIHMAAELFQLATKVKMLHIPFKGEGPAVVDLVGGHVQLVFANIPVAQPHVQAHRLRGLAVTSPQRVKAVPDFPTVAESGVPGFETASWFGMFAPRDTPADTVAGLGAAIKAALNDRTPQQKLEEMGYVVVASDPAAFARHVESEYAKWGKVIKQAGIKIQ
jgi:tripartite-type tricarboxylate transporter receptor subunit TctC